MCTKCTLRAKFNFHTSQNALTNDFCNTKSIHMAFTFTAFTSKQNLSNKILKICKNIVNCIYVSVRIENLLFPRNMNEYIYEEVVRHSNAAKNGHNKISRYNYRRN